MLLFLLGCAGGELQARSPDSLLWAVFARDQEVRAELGRVMRMRPAVPDSLLAASERMERADAENRRIVFGLLDEEGWPEGLSEEADRAIWMVIDHAELAAQKRYMPFVEEQVRAGRLSMSDYATLFDRIRMRDGMRQRYGTQTVSSQHVDAGTGLSVHISLLWPVEEPAALDSLRAAAGLLPIARYLEIVEEYTGVPCLWDSALEVEDMPETFSREER